MSRVNTEIPQSNPLFQQVPVMQTDDNIQLQGVQKKVWGQATPVAPTQAPATGSGLSHYQSANNLKQATS